MPYIITILALVIVFLSQKFYEYYKAKRLFENVKWCVSYNPSSFDYIKPEIKLRDTILHLQRKLSLDEKYLIADNELDVISEILKSFQQDLIQKYFNDSLSNCRFTNAEFFIIKLNDFLEKHQCKDTFNGNEMHTTKNYKTYGTWGVTSFSATYVLTDYAVTYYKALYITQLQHNELLTITNPNALGFQMAETTKKAIDTREIDVNNF